MDANKDFRAKLQQYCLSLLLQQFCRGNSFGKCVFSAGFCLSLLSQNRAVKFKTFFGPTLPEGTWNRYVFDLQAVP